MVAKFVTYIGGINMKKFFKRCFAVTAAASMLLVSSAVHAFAAGKAKGDEYDLTGIDLTKAIVKPTISISCEKLPNTEAKSSPVRTVNVIMKGADKAYANAGFTIRFDERLTLVKNEDGDIATLGPACSRCHSTFISDTEHGFRTIIMGSDNVGRDGVMLSFDVKLPDDPDNKGGKYPIELYYSVGDLFSNVSMDEESRLMEAWLFTQGIDHGYIEVEPKWIDTTSTTTKAVTTTTVTNTTKTEYTLGDTNDDSKIDSVDASHILRKFAELSTSGTASDKDMAVCDINNDGKIDSVDASAVLAYYALVSSNDSQKSFTDYLKEKGIRK